MILELKRVGAIINVLI